MLVVFPPIFNFVTPLDGIYMCLILLLEIHLSGGQNYIKKRKLKMA